MKKMSQVILLFALLVPFFLAGCANPASVETEEVSPSIQTGETNRLSPEDSTSLANNFSSYYKTYTHGASVGQWITHDLYPDGSPKPGFSGGVSGRFPWFAGYYVCNTSGKSVRYTLYFVGVMGWTRIFSGEAYPGAQFGTYNTRGVVVEWKVVN